MNESFFSAKHIQVLHVFHETYIENPSHDAQKLFTPLNLNMDLQSIQLGLNRKENSSKTQLKFVWAQFCHAPYNPRFCKILCDEVYRKQHTPQDRLALILITQILCKLDPNDEEAKKLLNTLSIPQKNHVLSTFIILILVFLFLFTYYQTSKKITFYDVPDIENEKTRMTVPIIWTTKEDYGIIFQDQGSHMSKIEESIYSFVILTQLQNQGSSSIVYLEGAINVFDQADQPLCSEPLIILEEHHGPLFPGDDGFLSTEIQCSARKGARPNRVNIDIDRADLYSSFTTPEQTFVSTFPVSPLKISKRFYSVTPIDEGYWVYNQFVIENQEDTPKHNIRLRIHYYKQDGKFLAIEERHVLRPNTNILPPKRHLLHSIGVRVPEEPYRMDIEVVDCE